jgi:predicted transcriptional regulator
MPRLGQVARYTAKGDRNAHAAMTDPLENRGFALWVSCQGKIKTSKLPLVNGPADRGVGSVKGYEVEVNLKRKCFDLWPGLNQMDRASQDSFTSEVYSYLRASGNAICVRKPGLGEHGIPVWWMRAEWNDVKAVGIFKQTELTDRERRLTPAEAGEDREPAPVTVSKREQQRQNDANRTAVRTNRDRILELIKGASQPIYQREIVDALQVNTIDVGRALRSMLAEKQIYRRLETRGERNDDDAGRYRYVYWHEEKVPLRKTPLDLTGLAMEQVAKLKPHETLRVTWMPPAHKKEVEEMISAGLLEWTDSGHTYVRLPEATTPKPPEPPVAAPAPAAAPTVPATPALTGAATPLALQIEQIVDAEVKRRMQGRSVDLAEYERLQADLAHETQARQRLEAALIEARAELSEVQRKWDAARQLFGG